MQEDEFRKQFTSRSKRGMLKRFFFYDRTLNFVEVPLFTEFSGKKKIIPMRNTQCLKPQCVYDIDELLQKYKRGHHSSFTNFICHTCKTMLDLQYFYLDEDQRKIVETIWNTYNKYSIQCTKVAIFKDGQWEAVLPEYIKRMYKKNLEDFQKKEGIIIQDDIVDDEPDEIIKYDLPLLENFDIQEYVELLNQEDEGEIRHSDFDILLRRYNLPLKWGEFMHIKNQVAFSTSAMGIFISYLYEYLENVKLDMKMQSDLKMAFLCIKATQFDRFSRQAQFHFIADNLEGPKANYSEYESAIIALHFDERWIAIICDIQSRKLKIIDFLEDAIARTTPDEIYELAQYLVEQIFQPYKFPPNPTREILVGQIREQIRNEIPRKLQIYCDCGHNIAQYLYYYILEEIELIKISKKWPQDKGLKQNIHNVKYKLGEQDYFTAKICWIILKMSQDTGMKIKVYDIKPKLDNINKDTLDDFIIEQAKFRAEKLWDDNQPKKTKIQISKGLGDIVEVDIRKSQSANSNGNAKYQNKVEKYWGIQSGIQFNNSKISQNNNQINKNKDNSILNNVSFQFGSQEKPNIFNESNNLTNKTEKELLLDIQNQNQKQEKPFLVMPKAELQQYLTDYKQQIIKEYKQQQLLKGFQQIIPGQFNLTKTPEKSIKQQDMSKLTQSQYEQLLLNLDKSKSLNQSEEKELKQLQQDLGMNSRELANMDANQYDQLLQMMNQ